METAPAFVAPRDTCCEWERQLREGVDSAWQPAAGASRPAWTMAHARRALKLRRANHCAFGTAMARP